MTKIGFIKSAVAALAMLLTTTGCRDGNHASADGDSSVVTESKASADTPNSEMRELAEKGIVLERVRNIYRLVRAEYMIHGGSYDNELFDKCFCSKSWNKLLMAVRCKEENTGTLFFEINPWSMTRYSGALLSYDEFEVEHVDLLSQVKRASVTFTVYEADTYTPARIELVYENGQWMIDNFYNLKYMINVRNCMWNYLANNNIIAIG